MSSHAKLFVALNAFGLSAHLAFLCSDYHELQTEKKEERLGLCGPLLQDVLSPFFQDGRPENDITHTSIRAGENKGPGFLWEKQKSFNFFLINTFSLHEILITMDCLTQGWVRWGICILEPLSDHPLFHLPNSTLWLLSTREYL